MQKFIRLMAVMAFALCVGIAHAQVAPNQYTVAITSGATVATWECPVQQYGALLSVQSLGLTNSQTLAVAHISTYATGKAYTNTVETALAAATLSVYPQAYMPVGLTYTAPMISSYVRTNDVVQSTTNTITFTASTSPVKPVWLIPGDKLLLTISAVNTGDAYVVLKTSIYKD
jgi:hypothetical protein